MTHQDCPRKVSQAGFKHSLSDSRSTGPSTLTLISTCSGEHKIIMFYSQFACYALYAKLSAMGKHSAQCTVERAWIWSQNEVVRNLEDHSNSSCYC